MRNVPDGSVDLVLCDLPFGITECAWDRKIDSKALWREYARTLAPGGAVLLFAVFPFCGELTAAAPKGWSRYEWVWDKAAPSGHGMARKRPMRRHEAVLVFSPGTPRYFPQGLRECCRHRRRPAGSEVYHGGLSRPYVQNVTGFPQSVLRVPRDRGAAPAQKPVALLEYLIRTYTQEGETVMDNSMGLGSTGVAAVRCRRKFIGMEIDAARFRRAKARIEEAMSV